MSGIFVMFEPKQRLRHLERDLKDVVDTSIIAAFG